MLQGEPGLTIMLFEGHCDEHLEGIVSAHSVVRSRDDVATLICEGVGHDEPLWRNDFAEDA